MREKDIPDPAGEAARREAYAKVRAERYNSPLPVRLPPLKSRVWPPPPPRLVLKPIPTCLQTVVVAQKLNAIKRSRDPTSLTKKDREQNERLQRRLEREAHVDKVKESYDLRKQAQKIEELLA